MNIDAIELSSTIPQSLTSRRAGSLLRAWTIMAVMFVSIAASPNECYSDITDRGFQVGLTDGITNEVLQELKQSWKINLVRLQVGDNTNMDGAVGQQYLDMMERVFQLVDRKLPLFAANNIKVVFTLYSPPGGFETRIKMPHHAMFSRPELQRDFISIWEAIIDRYGNHPAIYAFDLSNEPAENPKSVCDACKSWTELLPDVVAAIRAKGPTIPIIVKAPYANASKLGQLPLFNDPQIIYNYHAYAFTRYQHTGLNKPSGRIPRPSREAVQRETYGRLRSFIAKWIAAHKKGQVSAPLPKINVGELAVSACAEEPGVFLNDLLATVEGSFDEIDGDLLKTTCSSLTSKRARTRCNKKARDLKRKFPLVAAMRQAHSSWTYHGFDDAPVWDPRYMCSPPNQFVLSPTETEREIVLKGYFSRNTH